MTLNINLTPELEKMVRAKVAAGHYGSASEVIREALRLMEMQDELRRIKLERLRRDIQEGLESPTAPWDKNEIIREGRRLLSGEKKLHAKK